jgi:hypothetical protein
MQATSTWISDPKLEKADVAFHRYTRWKTICPVNASEIDIFFTTWDEPMIQQ